MSGALASSWGPYFKKGPDGNDRPASLGNDRAELAARRIKGGNMRRTDATRRRQQTIVGPTNIVGTHPQVRLSEQQVAEHVSAMLVPFSPDQLADVAGRNPETARQWKLATRAPNSSSLLAIAKAIPAIGDWVISELGRDTGITGALENPQTLGVILSGLQAVALQGGVQGAIARKLISQITGGTP
jgi:hypothetical protein